MKKITTILAVLFIFTTAIQAQTLQSLFDRYSSDDRFEYVSLGKSMMNMATTFGGVGKNDKQMMSKMNGKRNIASYSYRNGRSDAEARK